MRVLVLAVVAFVGCGIQRMNWDTAFTFGTNVTHTNLHAYGILVFFPNFLLQMNAVQVLGKRPSQGLWILCRKLRPVLTEASTCKSKLVPNRII